MISFKCLFGFHEKFFIHKMNKEELKNLLSPQIKFKRTFEYIQSDREYDFGIFCCKICGKLIKDEIKFYTEKFLKFDKQMEKLNNRYGGLEYNNSFVGLMNNAIEKDKGEKND